MVTFTGGLTGTVAPHDLINGDTHCGEKRRIDALFL
jgi:hypothetical protein